MKVTQSTQFKKDAKRQPKRGKDLDKLFDVIDLLISAKDLPASLRDQTLTGNWKGWRDCHIEPDWLLIYKMSPEELVLGRTGTHSDLF
ncbi:MAG: type II toxin-antitoxin system YafQ family toxin [Akkermansiaceae bacterium]|jgi:mRNA interferase YafQ